MQIDSLGDIGPANPGQDTHWCNIQCVVLSYLGNLKVLVVYKIVMSALHRIVCIATVFLTKIKDCILINAVNVCTSTMLFGSGLRCIISKSILRTNVWNAF